MDSGKHKGVAFTVIIVILAFSGPFVSIALPSYQQNNQRAYYAELVEAAASYRSAVNECAHNLGTLEGCDAGSYAIPPAIHEPEGVVASLEVNNGIIIVTPVAGHKILASDTYVLRPTLNDKTGRLKWVSSGAGVEKGYTH